MLQRLVYSNFAIANVGLDKLDAAPLEPFPTVPTSRFRWAILFSEHACQAVVEDWFKDAQTRNAFRDALEEVLDANLPDTYDKHLFQRKRDDVFDAILDYAISGVKFAA